jgi:phosphoglycolate phosphatase-like HAD superfamily hydrolase
VAHLVWDWNGTLLDDITQVVAATNVSLATVGGPAVTVDEHRREFRRPISSYYEFVLGRTLRHGEFEALDRAFHEEYRARQADFRLAVDAWDAIAAWPETQSLLSMFFHHELVPVVSGLGLEPHLSRVDGLRDTLGGGPKAPHLRAHLDALGVSSATLYAGGFTDEARLRGTGHPVATTLLEAVAMARAAVGVDASPDPTSHVVV